MQDRSKKMYPSSFSMPIGQTVKAPFHNGCLRFRVFQDLIPRQDIPVGSQGIGELGELAVMYRFPKDANIEREVPVKHQLEDGFLISGRIDFLETTENGKKIVHEVKSTGSRYQYTNGINKGKISETHLGQLITYMSILQTDLGFLHLNYFHFNRKVTSVDMETRIFKVELRETKIFIDGKEYDKTAIDILRYWAMLQNAIASEDLPPKPVSEFACDKCPFSKVCEKNIKDKTEFTREVNQLGALEPMPMNPFKLNVHDAKRR